MLIQSAAVTDAWPVSAPINPVRNRIIVKMSETESKPFLSRWAQRKAASKTDASEREEGEPEGQLVEAADTSSDTSSDMSSGALAAPDETEEEAALSDEELCARYELPDPQACTEAEQLDGFFEGRIPDRLRQLAMRRMWRLNPLFRFADEMVEYGEDFTDAATVIPNMQTAYKVGKGYLDKILAEQKEAEELAAQAAQESAQESAEEVAEGGGEQGSADELAESAEPASEETGSDGDESQAESGANPHKTAENAEVSAPVLTAAGEPALEGARSDDTGPENRAPENRDPEEAMKVSRPRRMVFTKNEA